MLLSPSQPRRRTRQQQARERFLPAPTGWISDKGLSEFKPRDAVVFRNVIATEQGVTTRPGCTEHAEGMTDPVTALLTYEGLTGSKLFAATADSIYDVTASGSVGAAAISSLTSGVWTGQMFATTGGNFLYISNGSDAPRYYDGSSWTTPTITGVTASTLWRHATHQNRLWFVQKNTAKAWYLGAGNLSGAATSLDLGPFSALGGTLHSIASWTRDGGSGLDDVVAFVMSTGETHIYAGYDPSDPSSWSKTGTFKLPAPLGCSCVIKYGSDVGLVTEAGVIPLSSVLSVAASEVDRVAATEDIGAEFQTWAKNRSLRGWQIIEWPERQMALVNVPVVEDQTSYQYVYSTTGGGWSEWRDLNALSWGHVGNDLYFGTSDGRVCKMIGSADEGEAINATIVHRFENYGVQGEKVLRRVRTQTFGPSGYQPHVGVRVNFDENTDIFSAQSYSTIGPEWDDTEWDVAEWGVSNNTNSNWIVARGKGHHLALVIQIATTEEIVYNGAHVMFEVGDAV